MIQKGVPQALSCFVEAFLCSMPTGKQNTFANRTQPDDVYIVLREDFPMSLVNAFEQPVPAGSAGGYLAGSESGWWSMRRSCTKTMASPSGRWPWAGFGTTRRVRAHAPDAGSIGGRAGRSAEQGWCGVMSTLLLRLAAPMQSWGDESKFTTRRTLREPTKSGVVGLLGAAMGIRREQGEEIARLSCALRMGVRVDQEGEFARISIWSRISSARIREKSDTKGRCPHAK